MEQRPVAVLCVAAVVSAFAMSLAAVTGQTAIEQRIARVEGHLLPGIVVKGGPDRALTIADRMRFYHTPGASVAVVNDGTIEWARAWGVLEAGTTERATPRTRFQAASISKPVTAMAALRLVQDGRLSLDGDVNAKLTSWKMPENGFTKTEKVTLRRILSHSAGLTVHGFPGYASTETLPTLVQILDGVKPANTAPMGQPPVVPAGCSAREAGPETGSKALPLEPRFTRRDPGLGRCLRRWAFRYNDAMASHSAATRATRLTVRRFASAAEADRHDREYWRTIPEAERILLTWQLSAELWRWRGELHDEPGLCRSVASIRRP